MMKVKILKNVVGPLGSYKKGKVYNVTNERAKHLLDCKFAEVIEEVKIEKAVKATKKTTRKKTTK
jgi:hypothetical protein